MTSLLSLYFFFFLFFLFFLLFFNFLKIIFFFNICYCCLCICFCLILRLILILSLILNLRWFLKSFPGIGATYRGSPHAEPCRTQLSTVASSLIRPSTQPNS